MLKAALIGYWGSLGVENLEDPPRSSRRTAQPGAPDPRAEDRRRALALIQEAAMLLSGETNAL